MSTTLNSSVDPTLGNVLNVFNIVNTLIFMGIVLANHEGKIDILSSSYARDGFCVSNQDKSIWVQSHALSFYGDTIYSFVLLILTKYFSQGLSPVALKPAIDGIAGTFGHGCAHLWLAMEEEVTGGILA